MPEPLEEIIFDLHQINSCENSYALQSCLMPPVGAHQTGGIACIYILIKECSLDFVSLYVCNGPQQHDVLGNLIRVLTLIHGYPTSIMPSECGKIERWVKAPVPFPSYNLMHAP